MKKKLHALKNMDKISHADAVVQNCNFHVEANKDSEAVTAIARALEANAEALRVLADKLDRSAPMISINEGRVTTAGKST